MIDEPRGQQQQRQQQRLSVIDTAAAARALCAPRGATSARARVDEISAGLTCVLLLLSALAESSAPAHRLSRFARARSNK